jgi:hypothetical protein
MNSKAIAWLIAIATFLLLAIPVRLFCQDHERKHHRYRLVDVGTFGGPDSYFTFGAGLNNRGAAAGAAATPAPDPFNPI